LKLARLLSRIALLSLAAAAFVGLTEMFGASVRLDMPEPHSQAARAHRPLAPRISLFPEFIGQTMIVAIFAVGGRLVLRLRLSPAPRSEGQPISLGLQRR